MRVERSLFDALTNADKLLAEEVLKSDVENFAELGRMLSLDPKSDYKYLDLSGVDFSDCDLRGYDFTGCDLRGATGVNVRRDETTILADACVDGSMFALEQQLDDFLRSNESARSEVRRLSASFWTDASLWVGKNVKRSNPRLQDVMRIAMALFRTTKDPVVRSDVVHFSRVAFTDGRKYREFLLYILSMPDVTPDMVITTLRILSLSFNGTETVFRTLLSYMDHDDYRVRLIVLDGVVRSRFFSAASSAIAHFMKNEVTQYVRMNYYRLLSTKVARATKFEEWLSRYQLDPRNTVTIDVIVEISREWGRNAPSKDDNKYVAKFASDGILARVFEDVPVLSRTVAFLRSLEKVGLAIQFSDLVLSMDEHLRDALADEIADRRKRRNVKQVASN